MSQAYYTSEIDITSNLKSHSVRYIGIPAYVTQLVFFYSMRLLSHLSFIFCIENFGFLQHHEWDDIHFAPDYDGWDQLDESWEFKAIYD